MVFEEERRYLTLAAFPDESQRQPEATSDRKREEMRNKFNSREEKGGGKGQFILRGLRNGCQKSSKNAPAWLKTDKNIRNHLSL